MELFAEKLTNNKFLILIALGLVEIIGFIILFVSYKSLYLNVFEETKVISLNKTLEIAYSFYNVFSIYINRYIQDVKLIGRHMSFLSNKEININSHYYQKIKNNSDKNFIKGTLENLESNDIIEQIYIDNNFSYFNVYAEKYINNADIKVNILNELMNKTKHPELNSIAFINQNGKIEGESEMIAKYLISILKTNILKRFIVEGEQFEIKNYILINKDALYIYPPKPLSRTLIYPMINKYKNIKNNNNSDFFGKYIYDYLINNIPKISNDSMIANISFVNVDKDYIEGALCLNIPFNKQFDYFDSIICIEVNLTKMFGDELFEEKEGFSAMFIIDIEGYIRPLYSDKKRIFDDIKTILNHKEKYQKYPLYNKTYNLFYFLYNDLLTQPDLLDKYNISLDNIYKEYQIIHNTTLNYMNNFDNKSKYKYFEVEKTSCKSDIYYNGKKCNKDNFLIVLQALKFESFYVNKNFVDVRLQSNSNTMPIIYSMCIINNNNKYMEWKFNKIIIIKIVKLFLFYFIASMCVVYLFFIFIQIFFESKYDLINKLLQIIRDGSFFELKDKDEILQKKEEMTIEPNNKEMAEIKNLFDYMAKTMMLKLNFDQNEIFFNKNNTTNNIEKIDKANKNQITNNNNNKNNIDTLNEYTDLINNIINNEIRLMFSFIISYGHFRKKLYKLSENEFKNLVIEMNIYQNKISNKNENNDSKLKDSISRCSKISYLNEYSLTNELSETTLPIIKAKLMAQKIFYLYAMCIYNQEKIKSNNENNKKYNKENAKQRYEEAIKYFVECKNISILLGTDTIRQIFSLIMISKCYIELKNYKESMINLNEALLLYTDLQKTFKDKPYFNPKIMLFAENYIFQNIMLSFAQVTFSFNKYPQSCWILMKMIETSPFIFNNIHYQSCFLLSSCLNQIENSFSFSRQVDKYKKRMNKIFSRINIRLINKEKFAYKESRNNTSINYMSNPSATNTQTQLNAMSISVDNCGNSSNLKKLNRLNNKELYTNKISISISSFNQFARNRVKYITLCMSEKLLQEINAIELKDVIIKFFKKCFSNGIEDDKFGYIQFSLNGKKTISIKSDSLDIFLQKLETNKMAFKINEAFNKNNNEIQFMEFSNLFLSIIKSHKQANFEDRGDQIIIIFINTSDIRFNGRKECVDTINELNNNNYTVIIFTYDIEIDADKIMGIYNFVYGLNDGHFFQVKNYQQIKQVLMNFGVKDSQEKFKNYNYEITDFML